jgi:exodeoxyribonuclease V beta subunit
LEFEHVIVMDRLKKAPPARDAIIYEYDGITLKNIYLRIKGRESVDKHYANAILKEKTLSREDSLNALYVAFTRSRENLFIIAKSKDSMFDILDLKCQKNGILKCKELLDNSMQKRAFRSLEYKSLYYGTQSDILVAEKEQVEDLKSINFGVALHYMLEMLGCFEEKNIAHAKDMMINKYGHILENDEIEDLENRVKILLKNEQFLALVNGECYREKAIRYKNNLRYIDLLVKNGSKWNVIDYKSSISYQRENINQVNYYVKAIKEITGDEVHGYICYLKKSDIKIVKI